MKRTVARNGRCCTSSAPSRRPVAGDTAERVRQLREAMRLYEAMGAPLNARRVAQMMEVAE